MCKVNHAKHFREKQSSLFARCTFKRRKTMKKAIALTLATAMSASLLAGCGGSQNGGSQTAEGAESSLPAYNELTVGTDYTDLKADLKFISHRTDLVDDGTFAGYVAEFQKMYPNITISYEGITTTPTT